MKSLFKELSHKDLANKSGIYLIQCNEHTYIGSSKNIYYRLKRHSCSMSKNKHANSKMQNIYNKRGKNPFVFKIIELCHEDIRIEREGYYIRALRPDINLELDPVEKEFTTESKEKISKGLRLYYRKNVSTSKKEVHQYSREGNYIQSFNSLREASESTGVSNKSISCVLTGSKASSKGYFWSFSKDSFVDPRPMNGNKHIEETNSIGTVTRSWLSISECARELGIAANTMTYRIRKQGVFNGLRYRYKA